MLIRGFSSTNTITLRPAAGNTNAEISGNLNDALIKFFGVDYFIIDGRPGGTGNTVGLLIENTSSSPGSSHTLLMQSGVTNSTIKYVHFKNGGGGHHLFMGQTLTADNIIDNCIFEGGTYCIGIQGIEISQSTNNKISNCKFFNFKYVGVNVLSYVNSTTIEGCEFYNEINVASSGLSAITFNTNTGGVNVITRNKIHNLKTNTFTQNYDVYGIRFRGESTDGAVFNVFNNFISLTDAYENIEYLTGIDINGSNPCAYNIIYNSILIGGNHTGGSNLVVSMGIRSRATGGATAVHIKNNILLNKRTGGGTGVVHAGAWYQEVTASLNLDYNSYYAIGVGGVPVVRGATQYSNISNYKAASMPNEQNSIFENVFFVSDQDLHLTGTSNGNTNLTGTPLPFVLQDIDGEFRNAATPYMGADEAEESLIVTQISVIADSYTLSQNYPNPFNPSTTINFSLKKSGFVSLKIYDITGREISELVNDELLSGSYELIFDASNLSSGVYFYTIKAGEFVQTKQMILTK